MGKKHKIITVILISLMALSLICLLIFWLPFVSVEWARLIYDNPITDTLCDIYNKFSLVCTPIAFFNAAYAIMWLEAMYKSKSATPKRLTKYWAYLAVSLGALVLHWISFREIFSWVIAG
ncbi:MAG: hypothetical protein K2J76_09845 [Oscillospiraceae bacterium]|nr:hypothetical protein [Oscillospiraceae bacterium]